MGKIRIYEIAKEMNFTSKEMVNKLNALGFEVKSPLNSVDQETADRMIGLLTRGQKQPSAPPKEKRGKSKKRRSSEKGASAQAKDKAIYVAEKITLCQLAQKMGIKTKILLKELRKKGDSCSVNSELTVEDAMVIAEQYGYEVENVPLELEGIDATCEDLEENEPRSPIVTVLGHVDHGKTTLLDTLRRTRVASGEDGGITQHIGAYQVKQKDGSITFIDTPGHEAFTAMRARGAMVTDIAILIVAADDGVMPQTVEAINHAKAAEVPIIVAVNKIDKPNANPAKVRQDLIQYELLSEDLGGETIFVDISAKHGQGIDELLEMILLQAEIMELTANPNVPARGIILEARLDKGRGPVASVLIENGTLDTGDSFVVGLQNGKVRALLNDKGERINSAGPATPVEVIGLTGVPNPGDIFSVVSDEKKARQICTDRQKQQLELDSSSHKRATLEELFSKMSSEVKELNLIIKTDVQGSAEAIRDAIMKLKSDKIELKIIHEGVGTIADTDVNLASTSNALIIGYRVKPTTSTKNLANQLGVETKLYRVIYELIEDIERIMLGMLDPQFKEIDMGRAEVREVFKVPKTGAIAGCFVESGKITRKSLVRVLRDSIVIFEGELDSLKHYKDDVKEILSGQECGLHIHNFNDVKPGDIIEAYQKEEMEVKL